MNTTAILAVAAIGFAVSAVSGYFLIPYLHKLHFGQTILDIGPSWHKNKQGTPTMGGFMFIFAILIASVVGYFMLSQGKNDLWHGTQVEIARYWGTILLAVSFGIIGFVDDYIKVVKKRNLGLTAIQKLIMQFVAAGLYMLILYTAGDTSTVLIIPFLGQLDLGLVYFPLCVVGIVYITNSVNLTDGLDGLCGFGDLCIGTGLHDGVRSHGLRRHQPAVHSAGSSLPRLPGLELLARHGVHGRYRLNVPGRSCNRPGLRCGHASDPRLPGDHLYL